MTTNTSKGTMEIDWEVIWHDPVKALDHITGEYSRQIRNCESLDNAAESIVYDLVNESGQVFIEGFCYFNETAEGFETDPDNEYIGKVTVNISY